MLKSEFIRVIGDIHGCVNTPHPRKNVCYRDIISDCKWSVQLGDMAFNYSGLEGVSQCHQFIPGNHDNYDVVKSIPNALDYGMIIMGSWHFFTVRGEWSIDIRQRHQYEQVTGKRIWWPEEELTDDEMDECLELYKEAKPDVVMSHSCPSSISNQVGNAGVWKFFGWDSPRTTRTQQLLEAMYVEHEPKLWLFGHFHRPWIHTEGETTFICIDELEFMDFNQYWEIV